MCRKPILCGAHKHQERERDLKLWTWLDAEKELPSPGFWFLYLIVDLTTGFLWIISGSSEKDVE